MDERVIEIKDIFDKIGNTPGKNDKIAIIKENADNELFVKTLKFVYDEFIHTGLSDKKINQETTLLDDFIYHDGTYNFEQIMRYLKLHNTGRHEDVMIVQDYINAFEDKDVQEFLKKVFTNNLKVGITAKSINKALGKGTIREFGCQLAHPLSKYPKKLNGHSFVLTQKLDGHRSVCIVKFADGVGTAQFFTRKGLEINGLGSQEEEAVDVAKNLALCYGTPAQSMVLDGELLLANDNNLATEDLFRETGKILRSDSADKSNITYNVFDALPLSEFEQGESKMPFTQRKQLLANAFVQAQLDYELTRLFMVQNLYEGRDQSMITKLQDELVKPNGWEGLMANLSDGKYVTKRTNDLLKIKKFYNADVLVTDVFEGTGKNAGTLGGIHIDYKGNDVKVGSGFTDEERDYFWEHPDEIVGHIIDCQYFEESKSTGTENDLNSKGLPVISLRFPTYKALREDKTVDDISYEV